MQIKVDHIYFTYPTGVKALDDFPCRYIRRNVAVVGRNGSGKTTFATHSMAYCGLSRDLCGSEIGDFRQQHRKNGARVAYVFQNPDEQLFCQRIWDEVAFGPQNLGYDRTHANTLVQEALSWVKLKAQANLNPRDLGYAGRKLVALAAALAMDTPAVIFDEPTAGLDASELEMLAQVLQGSLKGKTVVMISHDMDFVAENLDRIILIDGGGCR